jgi:hypothetical protein
MATAPLTKVAERIAKALEPSDGWWHSDTGDSVEEAAETMLEAGMEADDVEEVLKDLIAALRGEYGE